MNRSLLTFLLAVTVFSSAAATAAPVEINNSPALQPAAAVDLDVSLRLIGGTGAVLMPGRDINLTFQTSSDAYVIIYNIDSEGYVHLLYPVDGRPEMINGKKVHFLPEQGAGVTWEVGGDTGIEYIHAIAVDDPSKIDRDELYYLAQNSTMPEERRLRIDMDPFLAFNMIDEELIPDAERMTPATDYTYFYINRKVDYPGYLCYKCHSPSKIPDPYAMECPEVDIEMIGANEDSGYPYPQLFAVLQAGETAPEDEYESFTYYDDNLSVGYSEYDYDQQKVYLSVYYNYGYSPYYYNWPGYWSWYGGCGSNWYGSVNWGIGWGWGGGCYYHHYPFYSWHPYSHYAYWNGYNDGYWNGYYSGTGGYYNGNYSTGDSRSLYAGRSFSKRGTPDNATTRVKTSRDATASRDFTKRGSLDYTSTRVKTSREATLASSRLVKDRTRAASAKSYQRSRLARQVTRERASTGFRSFETGRYNTGKSRSNDRSVYGNYGTTRSARTTNRNSGTTSRTKDPAANTGGSLKSDKGNRDFERKSTRSATQRGTSRQPVGSDLEKRAKEREARRKTNVRNTKSSRDRDSHQLRKPSTRSGSSARTKKDSGKSSTGRSSTHKGTTHKSTTTRSTTKKSSSNKTSTRKQSSSSGSSGKTTTRSSSPRSSGSKSSGSRSSGSKSSGSKSTGRKR